MLDLSFILKNPEAAKGIQIVVDAPDLANFAEFIHEKAAAVKKDPDIVDEVIPAKKVLEMFGISEVTLWDWDRKEITKPFFVSKRKYYRRSDLEQLINQK
jgi:hypothetical protein